MLNWVTGALRKELAELHSMKKKVVRRGEETETACIEKKFRARLFSKGRRPWSPSNK